MNQSVQDRIVREVQAKCLDLGIDPSTATIVLYDDGTYAVDFLPYTEAGQ